MTDPAGPAVFAGLGRIDQFVPSFVRHDAISNHVVQVRNALVGAGYESDIFYEHLDPRLEGQARPFGECDPSPDPGRLLLYHASTSSSMAEWLMAAAGRGQAVAVDYHNITPSKYFARWEPHAARSMDAARQELAAILPWSVAAVADSAYNQSELVALGHRNTAVCPLLVDLSEYHQPPDPARLAALQAPGPASPLWLFVGRIAPNKCQHDVLAAFALYRRLYEPCARLALVGGATSPRYLASLQAMAVALEVQEAVELVGSASFPELLAYFAAADVFVCLSEHEGFCVPLIEAMELGVPVVAYRSSAVTETVASAGVLLDDKDPLRVAATVQQTLSDPDRVRAEVLAGRQRAADFSIERTSRRWLDHFGVPALQAATS